MAEALHLGITGMSCAGCAASVEKALKRVPGARDVSVNFALSTAELALDPPANAAEAVNAVVDAGYGVQTRTLTLEIGGMSCAGCAAAVERVLKVASGVLDARVNFAMNTAEVDLADADADPQPLIAAVRGAGYTASLPAANASADAEREAATAKTETAAGRMLLVSALLSLPFLIAMVAMLAGYPRLLPPLAQLALATPVLLIAGWRFHKGAVKSLAHGAANMDVLVSLGTSVAYLFSLWLMLSAPAGAHPHLYFEAAALIVTLVLFGKWLEDRAKKGATAAIRSLMALRPQDALIERGGKAERIGIAEVAIGDVAVIKPGERIPVDGVLISGITEADESLITGESLPVEKAHGDTVVAGSINGSGLIRVRATRIGADTTLSKIVALVAGTGAAAKAGILIRDIETLERAHDVDTVVFDKTGTLTEGRPKVVGVFATGNEAELVRLAAAAQQGSEHPLAKAILARADGIALPPVSDFRAVGGAGLTAKIEGRRVVIGTAQLLRGADVDPTAAAAKVREWQAEGMSVALVAVDGELLGAFGMSDTARPETREAIAALKARGLTPWMLSGDSAEATARVAADLGITEFSGGAKPEDKSRRVAELRARGHVVAVVGDGVNDAPALAEADVGIAVGSGTDVAMETAGITLMRPDPRLVAATFVIASATRRTIRQNLYWAFGYNVVGIPVAALGYLHPSLAAAAMAFSSVSVVANALRLKSWRPPQGAPVQPAARAAS